MANSKPPKKSIKLNFIMNSVLSMSNFVFPLITFPYVSRILLPVGTGKVSFATSLISYFSMFAQLGIPTYGIRACAKVRDDRAKLTRTAHELLFINLIMSAVSYIVLFVALFTVPRLREDRTLYLIVGMTILLTSIGMEWIYKALEQYTYITVRSVLFKVVALFAVFLLIHEQSDYVLYGAISIFAASASNIFNFVNVHKYISLRPVGKYNLRQHLKPVMVFFAMACASTVYTHLDTVMLGFMATDQDVGYYNAAVKIKMILTTIVTSLGTVLLPRVSYYVQNGQVEAFKRITKKAIELVFLMAIPFMVYFILFARPGILFLSGAAYENAILPMQIIMPTILFIGISNITGIQILVPTGRERIVLYSEIVGAAVDVIINALLIPRMVSAGAAIGTLVAEAAVLCIQLIFLKSEIREVFRAVPYIKIVTATALGAIASVWVKGLQLGNFATLLLSAMIFFGLYGIILLLAKEPLMISMLEQTLNKVKNRDQKGH